MFIQAPDNGMRQEVRTQRNAVTICEVDRLSGES